MDEEITGSNVYLALTIPAPSMDLSAMLHSMIDGILERIPLSAIDCPKALDKLATCLYRIFLFPMRHKWAGVAVFSLVAACPPLITGYLTVASDESLASDQTQPHWLAKIPSRVGLSPEAILLLALGAGGYFLCRHHRRQCERIASELLDALASFATQASSATQELPGVTRFSLSDDEASDGGTDTGGREFNSAANTILQVCDRIENSEDPHLFLISPNPVYLIADDINENSRQLEIPHECQNAISLLVEAGIPARLRAALAAYKGHLHIVTPDPKADGVSARLAMRAKEVGLSHRFLEFMQESSKRHLNEVLKKRTNETTIRQTPVLPKLRMILLGSPSSKNFTALLQLWPTSEIDLHEPQVMIEGEKAPGVLGLLHGCGRSLLEAW